MLLLIVTGHDYFAEHSKIVSESMKLVDDWYYTVSSAPDESVVMPAKTHKTPTTGQTSISPPPSAAGSHARPQLMGPGGQVEGVGAEGVWWGCGLQTGDT